MNDLAAALPVTPSDATRDESLRAAWLTAVLFLLLAFGSMAGGLVEASGAQTLAGRTEARATSSEPAGAAGAALEDPEVTQAERHWTWETKGSSGKTIGQHDVEEL